ncbi:MAG TPA: ABC transporter permease [Alphaproteobacteria bacterium]|nr:ABC transporter permease [Alphaproteobacteria bacterium]
MRIGRIGGTAAEGIDGRAWLVTPAVLLLLVVFLYPVGWLLLRSVNEPVWGLQNYASALQQPVYLRVFWNTIVISASVTALCLAIGYPVAYTMAHAGARARRFLVFIVLVPFWTSLLVRTFAWMVVLQRDGLINDMLIGLGLLKTPADLIYNRIGVLIGMVQVQLPFMILPLYSVLTKIDPLYTQAAATLGAPPWRNFLRVYLQLSLPGALTGCALVFIISLGYFITPALLGGRQDVMIAQLILIQIEDFGNWGLAAALAMILLVGTAISFALIRRATAARAGWAR